MLVSFDQITQDMKELVGSKAFNLSQLQQAGFPVPEGAVLTVETFRNCLKDQSSLSLVLGRLNIEKDKLEHLQASLADIRKRIQGIQLDDSLVNSLGEYFDELLTKGYRSVAVRSSCLLEDGEQSSFAGQFETILNVSDKEQLPISVLQCWASTFHPRVIQYCLDRKLPLEKLEPAIIVQGMINADTAGVLFSIDPMTGDDKTMVIDAVEGLADVLVQGEVTPQHYRYNWFDNKVSAAVDDQFLSACDIKKLGCLALDIQKFYGAPQDIEWAKSGTEFYVLQSRPIVSINIQSDEQWTNADFKDGGVASSIPTPLMWSLYENVMETTMPKFLTSIGLHPRKLEAPKRWTRCFFGFPYWNLSAVKNGVKKIPGFNERDFDEDLGITGRYEGKGVVTGYGIKTIVSGLVILYKINKSIATRLERAGLVKERISHLITDLDRTDIQLLTDSELVEWVDVLIEEKYLEVESEYFNTIYDNSNAATLFKDEVKKHQNKYPGAQINELKLISGLGGIAHLRHVLDLWELSRSCVTDKACLDIFLKTSTDRLCAQYAAGESFVFESPIRQYIDKFKHHSERELDLLVSCWDEDPKAVFNNLKYFLSLDDKDRPFQSDMNKKEEFEKEKLKIRSRAFMKIINNHRSLLAYREELRNQSTRMYRLIRRAFLTMGHRLVNQGVLSNPDEIFFLSSSQARSLFEHSVDKNLKTQLANNIDFYQSFINFDKPNEIFASTELVRRDAVDVSIESKGKSADEPRLRGIACSPGIVEGIVWVHQGGDIPTRLPEGTILVAKYTDPSYTLLFSTIDGLVTETGGVLSHGAVVSREYGIPAVLAVKNACSVLKTGMRVCIDGFTGEIVISDD